MYAIASIKFDKIFIVSDSIKKEFIFRKLIEKKVFLVSDKSLVDAGVTEKVINILVRENLKKRI